MNKKYFNYIHTYIHTYKYHHRLVGVGQGVSGRVVAAAVVVDRADTLRHHSYITLQNTYTYIHFHTYIHTYIHTKVTSISWASRLQYLETNDVTTGSLSLEIHDTHAHK